MSLSDDVKALEEALDNEKTKRREALSIVDEIRFVLDQYNKSSSKPWGRTLDKIGTLVGTRVID